MSYTLTDTQPGHLPGLYACFDEVAREKRYLGFTEAPPWPDFVVRHESLLRAGCPHVVLLDGETVLGWCDIGPLPGQSRAHIGVLGMALLPRVRGQGWGGQLLRAAVDRGWAHGFTRIELTVRADNERARQLYERFGFEHEGLRRRGSCIDGEYQDVHAMALLKG